MYLLLLLLLFPENSTLFRQTTAIEIVPGKISTNYKTNNVAVSLPSRGRRNWTDPLQRYNNQCSTLRLLDSGDVGSNPGPIKYTACDKTVRRNARYIKCEVCHSNTHIKCCGGRIAGTWLCQTCTLLILPFNTVRDLHNYDNGADIEILRLNQCQHSEILRSNGTSIAHLNTQSMTSSFPEFKAMLLAYKFNNITLSETWLKDYKIQLQHVSILALNLEFLNRQNKRGGGVGVYFKNNLQYKVRKDIYQKNSTIEYLWLKIKGNQKTTAISSVYSTNHVQSMLKRKIGLRNSTLCSLSRHNHMEWPDHPDWKQKH